MSSFFSGPPRLAEEPRIISGGRLAFYYLSDRGRFQDTGLSTIADLGDPVGGWPNLIGGEAALEQSVAGRRGVVSTAGSMPSGRESILFDGSDDGLQGAGSSSLVPRGSSATPVTILLLSKMETLPTSDEACYASTLTGTDGGVGFIWSAADVMQIINFTASSGQNTYNGQQDTNWHLWTFICGDSTFKLRKDGVELSPATSSGTPADIPNTAAIMQFGSSVGGTGPKNFHTGAFLGVEADLDGTAELKRLERWVSFYGGI